MDMHTSAWDYVAPLPVGRLRPTTILATGLASDIHHRTGPWVALDGDDSRLLRVGPVEELLLGSDWPDEMSRREPAVATPQRVEEAEDDSHEAA